MEGLLRVDRLLRRQQHLLFRRLDAREHITEIGRRHLIHQLGVFGQIERHFRREEEGIVPPLAPIDQHRQQLLYVLLIADEIVVYEIHPAPVAEMVQGVEFPADLLGRLRAGDPPEKLDDRAELAVVGTTAGRLQAHVKVVFQPGQIVPWNGRRGEVRRAPALKDPFRTALLPSVQPEGHVRLGFTEHEGIGILVDRRLARCVRSTDDHELAVLSGLADDIQNAVLLHNHAAHADDVGTPDIAVP